MKTKLLIITWILFPLLAFSQIKLDEEKWLYTGGGFNFQIYTINNKIFNHFYYLADNYIKIAPLRSCGMPKSVEFENGTVKKISDSVYCIVPNKLGKFKLTIDGKCEFFYVIKVPEDKFEIKFSASTSPFPDCITLEELKKSNEINVLYNFKKYKICYYLISGEGKDLYNSFWSYGGSDTLSEEIKKKINENSSLNRKISGDVHIRLYDSIIDLPQFEMKVVDSYEHEFVRRTLKISPLSDDLGIMHNDLRIKISGNPLKEDVQTIKELADELNSLLENIKVKIVDKQPSLTIFFDSINPSYSRKFNFFPNDIVLRKDEYKRIAMAYYKEISVKYHLDSNKRRKIENFFSSFENNKEEAYKINYDSIMIAAGYKRIENAYLKEESGKFFPFNKTYIMYYTPHFSTEYGESDRKWAKCILRKNILGLLVNSNISELYNSIFSDSYKDLNYFFKLNSYDKFLLRTLYSSGGEEKIKAIINKNFIEKRNDPSGFLLIILTICLLFVLSEIYNYYGIGNFLNRFKFKFIKRIIYAVLVAQVPIISWFLISLLNNDISKIFSEVLYFESRLIPFCVLSGLLLLYLDMLLKRIKVIWLNTILDLVLSFFSVVLAYQIMYFLKTPEIIRFSIISWEMLSVPLLITLYRLYIRFEKNKITSLLQEKELELSKQKELKFKSDLNALQARINPHFLYNALNSLASLTHIDQDRTEKMALSLSKLFRYNINKNEELYAPLKDEIEMAEIYLQVEKNRFEDKLNYRIELQDKLKEFVIPRFILQPLAENAVKHGISKITKKGVIRINIFEEAQKVIIEIYDNGPEFPGGLISGYGLQNVYEKLKLLYKKSFDISFINSPEKKLVIALTK